MGNYCLFISKNWIRRQAVLWGAFFLSFSLTAYPLSDIDPDEAIDTVVPLELQPLMRTLDRIELKCRRADLTLAGCQGQFKEAFTSGHIDAEQFSRYIAWLESNIDRRTRAQLFSLKLDDQLPYSQVSDGLLIKYNSTANVGRLAFQLIARFVQAMSPINFGFTWSQKRISADI
jgi:hypothetical protein